MALQTDIRKGERGNPIESKLMGKYAVLSAVATLASNSGQLQQKHGACFEVFFRSECSICVSCSVVGGSERVSWQWYASARRGPGRWELGLPVR